MNFDPSWATGMIEALDGQFADVYRASVGHFRRFGNVPVRLFRKGSRRSTRRPVRLGMCGVGRGEQLAIDVDGTTHGCAMFARSFQKFPSEFLKSRLHAIEMGDVRAPELASRLAAYPEAVRRVEIFDDKQDNYSSYGRCRDCRFLAPDFLCAFSLVSLKYRSRFPVERPVAVRSLRRRHAQLVEARAVLDAVARLQARR
jgi:hypothetical protein